MNYKDLYFSNKMMYANYYDFIFHGNQIYSDPLTLAYHIKYEVGYNFRGTIHALLYYIHIVRVSFPVHNKNIEGSLCLTFNIY